MWIAQFFFTAASAVFVLFFNPCGTRAEYPAFLKVQGPGFLKGTRPAQEKNKCSGQTESYLKILYFIIIEFRILNQV